MALEISEEAKELLARWRPQLCIVIEGK